LIALCLCIPLAPGDYGSTGLTQARGGLAASNSNEEYGFPVLIRHKVAAPLIYFSLSRGEVPKAPLHTTVQRPLVLFSSTIENEQVTKKVGLHPSHWRAECYQWKEAL
jgi:hypothetical protein